MVSLRFDRRHTPPSENVGKVEKKGVYSSKLTSCYSRCMKLLNCFQAHQLGMCAVGGGGGGAPGSTAPKSLDFSELMGGSFSNY